MVNDEKNRFIYFQSSSDLDALAETLDFYESQNGSSLMTNDAQNNNKVDPWTYNQIGLTYNQIKFNGLPVKYNSLG